MRHPFPWLPLPLSPFIIHGLCMALPPPPPPPVIAATLMLVIIHQYIEPTVANAIKPLQQARGGEGRAKDP